MNYLLSVILFLLFTQNHIYSQKPSHIYHKNYNQKYLLYDSEVGSNKIDTASETKIDAIPILMYDTDIGLGYGGKVFILNQFAINESIDLTLFNSTKGERWYRIVFSVPDYEVRQQKTYPVSFDFIIDYDKMINNNFYGVGSSSILSNKEFFTKEPIEAAIVVGRGFTSAIIGQFGLKYKNIRSGNYDLHGQLINSNEVYKSDNIYYSSLFMTIRYDTRNSFINPSDGTVISIEGELSLPFFINNVSFTKLTSKILNFQNLSKLNSILAIRLETTNLISDKLPVQMLVPIGGTNTLRGYSAERFIDKNSFVANTELRTILYKRLSAIVGLDAGFVYSSYDKIKLKSIVFNPTIGVRLIMDTFVVRLDLGISKETTGFYFNFGHLF